MVESWRFSRTATVENLNHALVVDLGQKIQGQDPEMTRTVRDPGPENALDQSPKSGKSERGRDRRKVIGQNPKVEAVLRIETALKAEAVPRAETALKVETAPRAQAVPRAEVVPRVEAVPRAGVVPRVEAVLGPDRKMAIVLSQIAKDL